MEKKKRKTSKNAKNSNFKKILVAIGLSIVSLGATAAGGYAWYTKSNKVGNYNDEKELEEPKLPNLSEDAKNLANAIRNPQEFLPLKANHMRIMNWNILNFGGTNTSSVNLPKIHNIATAMLISNASVIGLTEINYINPKDRNSPVVRSLDKLKEMLGGDYNYIVSPYAVNPDFPTSKENYAMYYNHTELEVLESKVITTNNVYVRPPFAVKFKHKTSDYMFWYVIAHFDAPGASSKRGESLDSEYAPNGAREILEAKSVYELIFKPLESDNVDIIFGGDTNLYKKANNIFESFRTYGIKDAYVDFNNRLNDEWYNTSLSRSDSNGNVKRKYANPYDKWLYKDVNETNITITPESIFKMDIVGLYNLGYWDKQDDIEKWERAGTKLPNYTDLEVALKTSDHAPIILDIKLD